MLFQQEQFHGVNQITRYDAQGFEINGVYYNTPVWFSTKSAVQPWSVSSVADITIDMLEQMAGVQKDPMQFLDDSPAVYTNGPEIILIGTGSKQQFLSPQILSPFWQSRIGVETMTSQAVARTYNILLSEGRSVVVGLMMDEGVE